MYFSSLEGIRTGGPNVRLANQAHRFRVAVLGDSHAFSLEVPFEESWSHHLQGLLGDDVQVLNFGVDGYGIDQMYLRYLRDVRPWKPQVVVIGFGGHDLWRTMAVYPFVTFDWPGYMVKPRFSMENGEPQLVNAPLPTPDQILNVGQIQQLPSVEYDLGYETDNWSWRFSSSPLTLRFLTSAFPRYTDRDPRVSLDATKALNSRLFTKLFDSIKEAGATPLLVFMAAPNGIVKDTESRAHVPFMDMTECVSRVPADRRKVPSGHHYTGLGNLAIARCTAPAIERALRSYGDPARSYTPSRLGAKDLASSTSARP